MKGCCLFSPVQTGGPSFSLKLDGDDGWPREPQSLCISSV